MKRKNIFQRMTMPLGELEDYYRERRQERFEADVPFGGVRLRRLLHPVLVGGMKIKHLLGRQGVTILGDDRVPTDRPLIYAATHIGWDDIEMILSSIGDHACLFWGDPHEDYRNINGFLLDVNGVIVCDTGHRQDRHVGKETCVRWLSRGGNLLVFPEGAWNITDSLPVMPLYTGTAEMAIRSGADIIPLAIEAYGRNYTIRIGRNIPTRGMTLDTKQQLTEKLRDAMAKLKWELWEHQPRENRAEVPEDFQQQKRLEIQKQISSVYTLEDIETDRFHTKAELAQREVEATLRGLRPRRENAFLFRRN